MRRPRPAARPRGPHLARGGDGPAVFVVGAGRLGGALAGALQREGWRVLGAWTRRARRRSLPGVTLHTGAWPEIIAEAALVLLCVPDRAVETVAASLAEAGLAAPGAVFAHCAGALELSVLGPLAAAGAEVGSLHPLVAVSPGTDLRGRACVLEGTPRALRLLRRAARAAGLRPLETPGADRARYHAAATLAAGGAVTLAAEAVRLLRELGIPEAGATAAICDLMDSAVTGVRREGLPAALTGPVARGDAAVVEDHLRALEGDAAAQLYRELALRALELARAQGGADPAGLRRIARILRAQR